MNTEDGIKTKAETVWTRGAATSSGEMVCRLSAGEKAK